jgi:hypothetical protein
VEVMRRNEPLNCIFIIINYWWSNLLGFYKINYTEITKLLIYCGSYEHIFPVDQKKTRKVRKKEHHTCFMLFTAVVQDIDRFMH